MNKLPAVGRVEGFDMLRGLCAVAVAYYHILMWTNHTVLYNLGTYIVYIFFVLSGASIHIAYNKKLKSGYPPDRFLLLRVARLGPLYILISLCYLCIALISRQHFSSQGILALLNISFLFGLGVPGVTSSVTGGWSLGIEFLFYLMAPIIMALTNSRAWIFVLLITLVGQHLFIDFTLGIDNARTLEQGWIQYTQMLSFVFYFVAGCCLGRLIETGIIRQHRIYIPIFIISLLPIIFYQTEGNLVGVLGWALSICSVLVAASSAGLALRGIASSISDLLGKASYGIYLIHPLVFLVFKRVFPTMSLHSTLLAMSVVSISALLALLVEYKFEAPIRNMIKSRMTPKVSSPLQTLV